MRFAARCNEMRWVSASLPLHPATCVARAVLETPLCKTGSGEKLGVLRLLGSTQERAGGSQGLNRGAALAARHLLVSLSPGVDVGPQCKVWGGT